MTCDNVCFDLANLWPLWLFLGLACCGIFQCWCAQKASVCVNGGEDTAAEPSLPSRSIPLGDGGEESDVAPISTTTTTNQEAGPRPPSSGVPDETIIASIFATLSIEERTAWYHEAFQRNQHEAILPQKRPKVTAEKDDATRPPAVRKSKTKRKGNGKQKSQTSKGKSQHPSDGSSVDAARAPRDNNQRSIQPKKDRGKGSRHRAPKPSAATVTPTPKSTASDRPKRASRWDATTSKGVAGPAVTRAAPATHREGCVVCLEDFRPGETIVWSETPSCPHVFHKDCLIRVFAHTPRKSSQEFVANPCPVCRQPFVTVGASNLENTCHAC